MKTTIATLRALLHDRLLALPWPYTTPQALDAFDAAAAAMPPPAPGALVTAEELAEVDTLRHRLHGEYCGLCHGSGSNRTCPRAEEQECRMSADDAADIAPRLAAEVRRLTAALDEAIAGEKLSEERTSALWHAVEAAANGADIEEHLRLLSAMGIDAEPVKTWARLASLLQDARAANEQLRGEIADERKAHAAALAAVQRHAAEVEKERDDLRAEVARLRGQEPGR